MAASSLPQKQQLFSLHGIRDSAGWQTDISRVFQAEFEHVPLRYREYHLDGAVKMFLWPWALLSAALVMVVWFQYYPLQVVTVTVSVACVACMVYEWKWSRWTVWLAPPWIIIALAVVVYVRAGPAALVEIWLLFVCVVFVQELRELQCDNGPAFAWWPLVASLFIGAGLIPIYLDNWVAVVCYGLISVAVAYWEAHRRRSCALAKVVEIYKRRIRAGSRAHWTAHSFGTYLTCRILKEHPTFARFDRMVLFGAIAPEDYDWHDPLLGGGSHQRLVCDVRNEFGYLDWAVPLATRIRGWGRHNGYGLSGATGFISHYAHKIAGAFGGCGICAGGARMPIHNVSIADYDHGSFLKPIHFRQLWLPYFWNYQPEKFEEVLQLCNTVAQNVDDQAYLDLALTELLESPWLWSPTVGVLSTREWLEGFIHNQTSNVPNRRQIEETALGLCQIIVEALDEFDTDTPNEKVLRCLKPPRAATTVVKTLVREGRL
jgi:hypothetical protein